MHLVVQAAARGKGAKNGVAFGRAPIGHSLGTEAEGFAFLGIIFLFVSRVIDGGISR